MCLILRDKSSLTRDSCIDHRSSAHNMCNANAFGAIHKASMIRVPVVLLEDKHIDCVVVIAISAQHCLAMMAVPLWFMSAS